MGDTNQQPPGLFTLLSRVARTGAGALRNRGELLAVEWQEERGRLTELLVWTAGFLFLAMMAAVLVTATVIFLLPPSARVYGLAGFALLFTGGLIWAWFAVCKLLRQEPFQESLAQLEKDREWLDSLN
jgi:uncharacterized membrane protein YqjE